MQTTAASQLFRDLLFGGGGRVKNGLEGERLETVAHALVELALELHPENNNTHKLVQRKACSKLF